MKKKSENNHSKTLILIGIFLIIFYIFNQMLTGDRGLVVWFGLNEQVAKMTLENNALKENIIRLEKKTDKLNNTKPDLDYIDEMVRRNLPVSGKNEKLILIK